VYLYLKFRIEGVILNQVEQFTHLGRVISHDARCELNIIWRINSATGVASSLNTIWKSRKISRKTKVCMYHASVLSVLLYNSETWTLNGTH